MEAPLFRRIQRYGWNAATAAYARGWVPLLEELTTACVDRARLHAGERVVDLATGTGVGARHAARAVGPSGDVLALDISEQMLLHAATQTAQTTEVAPVRVQASLPLPPSRSPFAAFPTAPGISGIRFERRDMENTGAAAGTFNAAVAAFALMYAADRAAACAEIMRVLAPGGRTSICVWGRRDACGWAAVFEIVDAHVDSEVCPLFFALGAPGALAFALRRAGLVDIAEERRAVILRWASADDACAAMLEGGPVALAWKRFTPAVRLQVRAAYLASLAPFRVGAAYAVPSEVVFATARKP